MPHDVEGEYIFPLPEGASVSRFAMWVDGEPLEAEVLDRDEARRIYEEIVRQRRDPALLEYAGRGAFRARVYPIPSHGEKRIELEYSEVLPADGGLVRYVYPLNTERFSTRPLEEASVSVRIVSREALKAIYSPSHEVKVRRDGDYAAEVEYREAEVRPDKDFVLYYTVSEEDLGANLISYKEPDEDGFFLLLMAPRSRAEETEIVEKDVIFVLDTSGSMRGEKLAQAKGAARYVLENLNQGDRFNIIAFSTSTRHLATGLRSADEAERARSFVNGLKAGGGTNIARALEEALEEGGGERPCVVIFLTDGLATEGEKRTERIIQRIAELAGENVRIFAFGVGYKVNTLLLDTISQSHHGVSSYVRPDEDIERVVSSFYEKISTPVLADVSIDFGAIQVEDSYPYPLPDFFAGSQVVLVGRYRDGGTARVTLHGTVNGQPTSHSFEGVRFRRRGGAEFIPRLWATRKIGHLLTQVRLHGADPELIEEIVELSVRYGVVTPYTSFLIDETEDALTTEGRHALAQRELTNYSGGGSSSPSPPQASGAVAVERSVAQKGLREAEVASQPQADPVRTAGNKAFVLRDSVWTDTAYDAASMTLSRVAFGSEAYFELARRHPELGRYLALGPRVTLVWEGRAYRIGAETDPDPKEPSTRATPAPTLARGPASPHASATPSRSSPTATPTPAPDAGGGLWQRIGAWVRELLSQ